MPLSPYYRRRPPHLLPRRRFLQLHLLATLALASPSRTNTDRDGSSLEITALASNPAEDVRSCYVLTRRPATGREERREFCFPSVVICGFAKAGTSAAYQVLARHPASMRRAHKEHCLDANASIFDYLTAYRRPHAHHMFNINGCIHPEEVAAVLEVLPEPPRTLVVFMVRNLPEKLWAGYNFWCLPRLDADCEKAGDWTTPGMEKTARAYHALLHGSDDFDGPRGNVHATCAAMKRYYRRPVERIASLVSEKNIFLTRNDDLQKDPRGWWKRFVRAFNEATEFHARQFKLGVYRSIDEFRAAKVNSNDDKGMNHVQEAATEAHAPGTYRISHFQPMREDDFDYIMDCWQPDCEWLSTMGVEYPCSFRRGKRSPVER